jgi:hypothetical protein
MAAVYRGVKAVEKPEIPDLGVGLAQDSGWKVGRWQDLQRLPVNICEAVKHPSIEPVGLIYRLPFGEE